MSDQDQNVISRREAVRRVSALLGGVVLIGGTSLMTACERGTAEERANAAANGVGTFGQADIAFLDEVADTILPTTAKSPGAKAAQTGAFMALMVTDTYDADQQRIFRDGMRALDEESRKAYDVAFVQATPAQRTELLTRIDQEAKAHEERRRDREKQETEAEQLAAKPLPDQRQEAGPSSDAGPTVAAQKDTEAAEHYFRMMKQLAMLGYFTSEIGYTRAMRYAETPGRYDGCAPYTPGDRSWAPHA